MKLLSIAIPCYNSQDYMEKCIKSLLPGGDQVEILIVNDGSKDKTEEIGLRYEKEYPGIVRLINKENGGHGSAVNTGLAHATGTYFKVVDSDDWVSGKAYKQILRVLNEYADGSLDALFSNFVYDKVGEKRKKIMAYKGALPVNKRFTWDEVGSFKVGQYILMHSVIYRTQVLRDCGLKLPEHTFYVDNIFVFEPLPSIRNMYYLDVNFYRYFIGREDQSVHESVMMGRIDQQLLVNRIMFDYMKNLDREKTNKRLYAYMLNYLEIITTISSVLLIKIGDKEALAKKQELWDYMQVQDAYLYKKLRFRFLGIAMNFKSAPGRMIAKGGYTFAQKMFKFN